MALCITIHIVSTTNAEWTDIHQLDFIGRFNYGLNNSRISIKDLILSYAYTLQMYPLINFNAYKRRRTNIQTNIKFIIDVDVIASRIYVKIGFDHLAQIF